MTYTCKLCSATSDKVEFYKGVTSRCKECHKQKVRENRANNPEMHRTYDAYRFQCDPKVRARHKKYQATPAGHASMKKARDKWVANNPHIIKAAHSKWLEENPEKRAAHISVGNAVRDGRLFKPDACEECGATSRLDGHHEDYSQPLVVKWLCRTCHTAVHKSA